MVLSEYGEILIFTVLWCVYLPSSAVSKSVKMQVPVLFKGQGNFEDILVFDYWRWYSIESMIMVRDLAHHAGNILLICTTML